jgi:hypothetical protein
MVPHSPATIHCPFGVIVTKELFSASPGFSAWTYSDQSPFGACTRNILALPESRWYGSM